MAMQIGKLLASAVIAVTVMAEVGIVRSIAKAPAAVDPTAPVSAYSLDVPRAYYNLSFTLSKRTGGVTPPVQARAFAYMGLALYESLVGGMPHHRSIASALHGIGPLPKNAGTKYWPLVASASMAEVMRGLWGDATNVAAQNIADIDALEQQIGNTFHLEGSLARRSVDYGHAVGAAIYQTSLDDGENRSYLTNFPTSYVPPVCDGCWVPTAAAQEARVSSEAAVVIPRSMRLHDVCEMPARPEASSCVSRLPSRDSWRPVPMRFARYCARARPSI